MFSVGLSRYRYDQLWLPIGYYLRACAGERDEDWTFEFDNEGQQYIFHFKDLIIAEKFQQTWTRSPLILPYKLWFNICTGEVSGKRHSKKLLNWTPACVLLLTKQMNGSSSSMMGGKRVYDSTYSCWFFEKESDALLYWMERKNV